MLVLSRKINETVRAILDEETLLTLLGQVRSTGENVVLTTTVVYIGGNQIRLGIDCPQCVDVLRGEITRNKTEAGRQPGRSHHHRE